MGSLSTPRFFSFLKKKIFFSSPLIVKNSDCFRLGQPEWWGGEGGDKMEEGREWTCLA